MNNYDNNKPLGMKWYIFYIRVRPWLVFSLFLLSAIANGRTFLTLMNVNLVGAAYAIPIIIYVIAYAASSFAYVVLFFKERNKDAESLFRFIKRLLVFEIFYIPYSSILGQYYEGQSITVCLIVMLIFVILLYFIWYKLNIKYFRKRLVPWGPDNSIIKAAHEEPIATENAEHLLSHTNDISGQNDTVKKKNWLVTVAIILFIYGVLSIVGSVISSLVNDVPILEGFGISPDEPILGTIAYVLGYFAPSIIGGILLLIWHSINRANKTQEPLTSTPQMPPLDSLPINQKLSDKEVEQSVSHLHKTRRSWGIRAAIIVLVVAIMLSIGANVHQFQQIQSLTEIKNSQDTEISKLERQLEDAQDSIATWIDKYEYAMVYKNYMDQHIVFLPNDASYIYHKFDCWVIEGKSCFIYNEELAQSYGYKACSLCH